MLFGRIVRSSTRFQRTGWRNISSPTGSGDPTRQALPAPANSFRSDQLIVARVDEEELLSAPHVDKLGFGLHFSNHMVDIDWDAETGWHKPLIKKLEPLRIHPAAKALHYSAQLFEGMKAHRGVDGKIRLFRPELNMDRMRRTALRACLPDFEGEQLITILTELVKIDADWVPFAEGASLYIRPTLIGTDPTLGVSGSKTAKLFVLLSPVGEYFAGGSKGVRLLADPQFTRAFSGGVGGYKMGSNYGPTVKISELAAEKGCAQVLWLCGNEEWVTEGGAMNIFVFWRNEKGEKELVTASLESGTVLPGVTRRSILDLTVSWGEFKVSERDFTMNELEAAIQEGRLIEMFSCGTAAVVTPVSSIVRVTKSGKEYTLETPHDENSLYKRLYKEITDIQYGRKAMKGWTRVVA